jgi:multimeric flavodoxin WrbA
MKIIGLSFSARKNGNCNASLDKCRSYLQEINQEITIINAVDYSISPCKNCNYECFPSSCVIEDDFIQFYNSISIADHLLISVPTYAGHMSALFHIFFERFQGLSKKEIKSFNSKDKSVIVIGNYVAGADRTTSEILDTFRNAPQRIETIVFSARDYNLKSTDGNIFTNSEALSRLKRFSLNIIKQE